MSQDITPIIAGWEFNPDELQVRIITALDGSEKIQMRVDLGLLQMELTGRPDGQRPHGYESLLEYHEDKSRSAADRGSEYRLDSAACGQLMREGLQYYHRYLSAFHLHRYDLVTRDTERNLRLFAFVLQHAGRQRDKIEFDRYRPYVIMMWTRARALQLLESSDFTAAIQVIDEGISGIREFLTEYHHEENESDCPELGFLTRWRREVESERPTGPVERLEQQLALVISLEDYEEAARIRDQLKSLRKTAADEVRRR